MCHSLCNPLNKLIKLPSLASTYTILDPLYMLSNALPNVETETANDSNITPAVPSVTLPIV